jgi:hypothetical protein
VAEWLYFGAPGAMKVVNVALVTGVEMRTNKCVVHLLGGETLAVQNEEVFDLIASLQRAGATRLVSKSYSYDPPSSRDDPAQG